MIVDYKSSKKKRSKSEIFKESHLKMINKEVDFQPIMYILAMRKHFDCDMELIFHYCLANSKDMIKGSKEQNDISVKVSYCHKDFNDFLQKTDFIENLGFSKDVKDFIKDVNLADFFRKYPLPRNLQFDEKKLIESDYRRNIEENIREYKGKTSKKFSENIVKLLRSIVRIREKNAIFFKDDVDEFSIFIKEKFNEIQFYIKDKFPYRPLDKEFCKECDFKDICLKHYEN